MLGVYASQGCTKYTDNDLMFWVPGAMAGLLEAVQKMVAGKADKEEVQALKRVLGDKVNLADHQVHCYDSLEMLCWVHHHHCLETLCWSICAHSVSACCVPCLPACLLACLPACRPAFK